MPTYSVIRYRADSTVGDGRVIGVALVDELSGFAGVRSVPISTISPSLRKQGLVDAMLAGLTARLRDPARGGTELLRELSIIMNDAVTFSGPSKAAAHGQPSDVLDALYKVYARPKLRAISSVSRWAILDRLVESLRSHGAVVQRGTYWEGFLFDAVAKPGGPLAALPTTVQVLSYAGVRADPSHIERSAGHFLFARRKVESRPLVIIEPPGTEAPDEVLRSFERVNGWIEREGVPRASRHEVPDLAARLSGSVPRTLDLHAVLA